MRLPRRVHVQYRNSFGRLAYRPRLLLRPISVKLSQHAAVCPASLLALVVILAVIPQATTTPNQTGLNRISA